jgi:hypothetical protein
MLQARMQPAAVGADAVIFGSTGEWSAFPAWPLDVLLDGSESVSILGTHEGCITQWHYLSWFAMANRGSFR